jgi:hypothetical protein
VAGAGSSLGAGAAVVSTVEGCSGSALGVGVSLAAGWLESGLGSSAKALNGAMTYESITTTCRSVSTMRVVLRRVVVGTVFLCFPSGVRGHARTVMSAVAA